MERSGEVVQEAKCFLKTLLQIIIITLLWISLTGTQRSKPHLTDVALATTRLTAGDGPEPPGL